MNEMLSAIKADLLSRRMLPWIALLGVGLIAAVAYVATAGGSGTASSPQTAATPARAANTLPVSVATVKPNAAVSETPSGQRYQERGSTRNPFTPLPETAAEKSQKSEAGGTSGSSSASSSGSSEGSTGGSGGPGGSGGSSSSGNSGGAGGETGAGSKKSSTPPAKPTKPEFDYTVTVQLGSVPATPGTPTQMVAYKDLVPGRRLPSKEHARITFERVNTSGTSAVFKLDVPPILHGPGRCLPSASECLQIALQIGPAEVLEYVEADGQVAAYELKVMSIEQHDEAKAAGAGLASASRSAHRATVDGS